MERVSATIIAYNEEANIAEALERLGWVDEIVVVDSGSSDGTLDICARYTDKVFHRDWTGFVDQKNYAVERASNNWILSLDADERPSAGLESEIQSLRRGGFERVRPWSCCRQPGFLFPTRQSKSGTAEHSC